MNDARTADRACWDRTAQAWVRIYTTVFVSALLTGIELQPVAAQAFIGLADLSLELDLGGSGEPVFHYVGEVALSKRGELYVADRYHYSVRVFDLKGRLLRQFGRRGAGPGEFEAPGALELTDSTIRVRDWGLQRTTTFTLDGAVLGTAPLKLTRIGEVDSRHHALFAEGELRFGKKLIRSGAVLGRVRDLRAVDHSEYLMVAGSSPRRDTLLVLPQSFEVFYRKQRPDMVSGVLGGGFGASGRWEVIGDSMVVVLDAYRGSGAAFVVRADGAKAIGRFDLRWKPLAVDAATEGRAARQRASQERGGKPDDWVVLLPAYFGQSSAMRVDDRGRIWIHHDPDVRTRLPEARRLWYKRAQKWYVVSPASGNVLATVELPANFYLLRVHGDRLIGKYFDELDVETVRVYRVPALRSD